MTKEEFKKLPGLVLERDAAGLGYDRRTLAKLVDCGVLKSIQPKGAGHQRYQKRQLALLVGWGDLNDAEAAAFHRERPLLGQKAVRRWTGYAEETLKKIVQAHGLSRVKPPGTTQAKYLRDEIGFLLGII